MKIFYVTSTFGIHDYRFLTKLSSSKNEIHLISFLNPLAETNSKYMFQEIISLPCLLIHHYKDFSRGKRLPIVLEVFRRANYLRQKISQIKPDVVHSGWVQTDSLYAVLAGAKPLLIMTWGSDILLEPKKSKFWFYLTKFVLSQASMVYSDCEEVKNRVINICPKCFGKTIVFPQLGIDRQQFFPVSMEEKQRLKEKLGFSQDKVLVMTRHFEPVYGVEFFVRALASKIEIGQPIRTVLIGGGSLFDSMQQLAKQLGVFEQISFLGRVDNKDLPLYYQCADIYVSSSLSDGTSLSLLEAMSCGLPVVVSDVPAYHDWIEDGINGYFSSQKNPVVLAEKIGRLLRDKPLMEKMRQKNLLIAEERIDWNQNFEKLLVVYQGLVS